MVTRQWGRECPGARCDVEILLHANAVARLNRRAASAEPGPDAAHAFRAFWAAAAGAPLAARNRIVMRWLPGTYLLATAYHISLWRH